MAEGKAGEDSFGPSADGANFVADSTVSPKDRQPSSPLRRHLPVTVTPANKLIKCVTVTQWHMHTDTERQENDGTEQTPCSSE